MKGLSIFFLLLFAACTPIKSSPKDEKHQLELTLHEVQTNIDDFRHDLNCFKADFQILEGSLKTQDNQIEGIKHHQISQNQLKIDTLSNKLKNVEEKLSFLEKQQQIGLSDIQQLSMHSKEVLFSLVQYKEKLSQMESNLISQSKHIEEIKKLKQTLEAIAASLKIDSESFFSYKVKSGDTLEKIAKINKISVDNLKKVNSLEQDLIVVGQELKIPK